jgi:hypothetical protein
VTQTQLDRRREQNTAAKSAADDARTAVTELANRLQTNADLTQQQTLALRNAEAEAKRLKRSLKTQARDRNRLEKAHQKAVAKASKASKRAEDMDDKYSKSVLADLVRREKERDQAGAPPATVVVVPEKAVAAAVESTARKTAARTTATRAAKTASAGPSTPTSGRATKSTGRAAKATGRATKSTGRAAKATGRATKTTGSRTRRR